MPTKTIKREWLPTRFSKLFLAKELKIKVETKKAYLLNDGNYESWVPKSVIVRKDPESVEKQGKALQDRINIPLLKAGDDEYNDLLEPPNKLLPYQKDVVKTLEGKKRVYLGVEQGLGKTIISIARTRQFGDGKPTLLVCRKSLFIQWSEQLQKFAPDLVDRFHIINYDMIWRDSRPEWMDGFHDGNFNMILDEVGCLGNEETKQTKKCMELAEECDNLQLLTGSFFGGRFEKCYPCTRMMGFTWTREEFNRLFTVQIKGKKLVRNRFGAKFQIDDTRIVGYKRIDDLIAVISDVGATFVRVKDVFNVSDDDGRLEGDDRKTLPKQIHNTIKVDLPQKLRDREERIYASMGVKTPEEVTADFTKFRVAESVAKLPDKLDAVKDLVSTSDDRWCIYYQFQVEHDALKKMLKKMKRPIAEVSGNVKDLDNYEKCGDSVSLLQIQAASEGLNLQKCHRMIFTSVFTPDQILQGESRIWRIGQKYPCIYYTVMTNGRWDTEKLLNVERSRTDVDYISSTSE